MPKKSQNKKTKIKSRQRSGPRIFLGFILLCLIILLPAYLLVLNNSKVNPARDYSKLIMKKIPEDVKRELKKAPPSEDFRIPVLLYHYVEYVKDPGDTIRKSLNIIPFIFDNQVKTLKDAGYTFMTMSEVAQVLDGVSKLPQKPVVLTFDDGYGDFYTDVLPILKKYNAHATAYVVSNFIGRSNFMNKKQIQEVLNSGLVEIGAHTSDHMYLKGQTFPFVQKEVVESKVDLEDIFHIKVVSFAYPYGAFDNQTINVVKNSEFETATTTIFGIEVNQADRYFIKRIRPGARMGRDLINYLENIKEPAENKPTSKPTQD